MNDEERQAIIKQLIERYSVWFDQSVVDVVRRDEYRNVLYIYRNNWRPRINTYDQPGVYISPPGEDDILVIRFAWPLLPDQSIEDYIVKNFLPQAVNYLYDC